MSYPFIKPGNDLTLIPVFNDPTTECGEVQWVSASQIQELVANIRPGDHIGFVWVSAVAPDTEAYPDFKKFIWIDLSLPWPYAMRFYNWQTFTWDQWQPPPNSWTGDFLIDGSVAIGKLNTGGLGNAKRIIQVDAQGVKFNFVFAKDAIDDGTFPIAKLAVPGGTPVGSYLTHVGGGVLSFVTLTTSVLMGLIADGSIPIEKLAPGAGKVNDSIKLQLVDGKMRFVFFSTFNTSGFVPIPESGDEGKILVVQKIPGDGTSENPDKYEYKLQLPSSILPPGIQTFDFFESLITPSTGKFTRPGTSQDESTYPGWIHQTGLSKTKHDKHKQPRFAYCKMRCVNSYTTTPPGGTTYKIGDEMMLTDVVSTVDTASVCWVVYWDIDYVYVLATDIAGRVAFPKPDAPTADREMTANELLNWVGYVYVQF